MKPSPVLVKSLILAALRRAYAFTGCVLTVCVLTASIFTASILTASLASSAVAQTMPRPPTFSAPGAPRAPTGPVPSSPTQSDARFSDIAIPADIRSCDETAQARGEAVCLRVRVSCATCCQFDAISSGQNMIYNALYRSVCGAEQPRSCACPLQEARALCVDGACRMTDAAQNHNALPQQAAP